MKERAESENVSPTAYATGYFWYRHGLSHEGLLIPEGRRMDRRFRLLIAGIRTLTGVSIDALMLARHNCSDAETVSARRVPVGQLRAQRSLRRWRATVPRRDPALRARQDARALRDARRRGSDAGRRRFCARHDARAEQHSGNTRGVAPAG